MNLLENIPDGFFFSFSKKRNKRKDKKEKDVYKIEYLNFQMQNLVNNTLLIKDSNKFLNRYILFKTYVESGGPIIRPDEQQHIYPWLFLENSPKTGIFCFSSESINLDTHLRTNCVSDKHRMGQLLHTFNYLLESIDILFDIGIVHNNLGFENIIIQDGVPCIKDFDVSLNLSKCSDLDYVRHFFTEHCPEYAYWPPEIHLMCYIFVNKIKTLTLEDIMNAIDTKNDIGFLNKYVDKDGNDVVKDIFTYAHTWDRYALSVDYIEWIKYIPLDEELKEICADIFNSHNFNPVDRCC